MNYYESLLESYSLLRKRKFKLSLIEEGATPEQKEQGAQEAIDWLGGGGGNGGGKNGDLTGIASTNKEGTPGIKVTGGAFAKYPGFFAQEGGSWSQVKGSKKGAGTPISANAPANSGASRLVAAFTSDESIDPAHLTNPDTPWDGVGRPDGRIGMSSRRWGVEDGVEDEELEDFQPMDPAIYNAIVDAASILGDLITTKEDYGELAKEIEQQLNAINENTQAANAELERAQARGEREDEKPIDVVEMFEGVKDVAESTAAVKSDPSLGDPNTPEGVKFSQKISDLVINYDISIDKDGLVRFGTTSLGITSESNFGILLSESIQKLNEVQEVNKKALGAASTAVTAKAPKLSEADRGVAGENFDVLSPYFEKCTTQERGGAYDRAECNKLFDMLTSDVVSTKKEREGFLDSALVTFAQGDQALAEEIFTGETGRINAHRVRYAREFLKLKFMEEQGMDEAQAEHRSKEFISSLVQRTAGEITKDSSPDERVQAAARAKAALRIFFISLIVNKEFGENFHGIATPTSSEGAGQGQDQKSNVLGAKVDVLDKYSKEEYPTPDKIKEQIRDNLLSDQQKDYYEEGCDEDIDSTIDGVIKDKGAKGYEVERELKIHGSEGKSAWGQTSHGKRKVAWDYLCDNDKGETLEKTEREAIDNVKSMMHNGGCQNPPQKDGKDDTKKIEENEKKFEASCEFNNGVQKEISNMTGAFDLDNNPGVEGTKGSQAVKTAIDLWTDDKSEWFKRKEEKYQAEAKDRRELAQKYADRKVKNKIPNAETRKLAKDGNKKAKAEVDLFDEQKEAFDKIQGEIENAIIAKHLNKHMDEGTGLLKEPALGYAQAQYAITVQGLNETLNDKRVLEDNAQYTMLRNAEARANIRSGRFQRSKITTASGEKVWSSTISILGKDQHNLGDLDDIVDDAEYKEMETKYKADKKLVDKIGKGKKGAGKAEERMKIFDTQKQRRELKKELEGADTAEKRKDLYAKYPLAAPKDDAPRASIIAERTNSVVRSGTSKAVGRQISKKPWNKSEKSTASQDESFDLFKEFLQGQQDLLEILLNQTT